MDLRKKGIGLDKDEFLFILICLLPVALVVTIILWVAVIESLLKN